MPSLAFCLIPDTAICAATVLASVPNPKLHLDIPALLLWYLWKVVAGGEESSP